MLEKAEERVKLLKKGLSQKEIEKLHIEHNNFKVIRTPILYDANKFDNKDGYFENLQITKACADTEIIYSECF